MSAIKEPRMDDEQFRHLLNLLLLKAGHSEGREPFVYGDEIRIGCRGLVCITRDSLSGGAPSMSAASTAAVIAEALLRCSETL